MTDDIAQEHPLPFVLTDQWTGYQMTLQDVDDRAEAAAERAFLAGAYAVMAWFFAWTQADARHTPEFERQFAHALRTIEDEAEALHL